MVDTETQDVAAGPAGAPINRDARRDPGVIEGEIAARGQGEDGPPPRASGGTAGPSGTSPEPPARAHTQGFAAGALAGLIVSALAAGAVYSYLTSKIDLGGEADRLAGLEAQVSRENAAVGDEAKRETAAAASLDKRISALEAGGAKLDRRLSALEAANADNAPKVAAASDATQGLTKKVADLRADVDAARGEIPGLSARVARLETEQPNASAGPDLSALAARVDKIEAALAAPKSETRAAAEKPSSADNAPAVAIIAEAIENKLAEGAAFAPELAELARLGVDPEQLAPLEAVAGGAPTNGTLAASFEAVAPKMLAATSQPEKGGIVDRFLAHMRGLVRVRDLNEPTAGDDPQALVSQIEAACRRGDVKGALAAFGKLPEAARQAAGAWPAEARARLAADGALQSIRDSAIARLVGSAKP